MTKSKSLRRSAFLLALTMAVSAWADDAPAFKVRHETIDGPATPAAHDEWLKRLTDWRTKRLADLNYNGDRYKLPELAWAQHAYIQPQMMVEDRYFFDPVTNKYTVDRYLDDLDKRYGGIDAVLVWPVYPNIGIDNRSQHDMLHDLPGGIDGVKQMVADFHKRGVHVLFPAMPWDIGSRAEGVSLAQAAARDMKAIDADGLNGDTFVGMGKDFQTEPDKVGHPLSLQPEDDVADDAQIAWNNMSWGYWPQQMVIPPVSKNKWLESRNMTNVCARWAKDRTNQIQQAFFNGTGYESWENIWGIWNGITPRDAEAIRRVGAIERAFADQLNSPEWQPHVPTLQAGIYASKFPGSSAPGKGITVWTFVNRSDKDVAGNQIQIPVVTDARWVDLWHGKDLSPSVDEMKATFSFDIEAHGYGAIAMIERGNGSDAVDGLIKKMADLSAKPLSSFSNEWKPLPQQLVAIDATKPASAAPDGMIKIPAAQFHFVISGVEIEGWGGKEHENDEGIDVQYPWETVARRHHDHTVDIKSFFIDKFNVTNAQFKTFLDASHYKPIDDHNFLRDWKGDSKDGGTNGGTNGAIPQGWENKPVTWISLEDARAYAKWAGKRLPHEWEWQYAAQGTDGRAFPWGSDEDETAIPPTDSSRTPPPPYNVDAHPRGASPFGVMDLTGNVWQYTDEYTDDHTRAAILRGGSYYRPSGSDWYFPRNTRLDQHGKYLLMAPSKDRSGMVGFRCVVDAGK